jgi:hypothetical protein
MARRVNHKCQHCATLTAEEAIALHGTAGDNCWNPDDIRQLGYNCHRRRNHYRHRDDDNRNRRRLRKLEKQGLGTQAVSNHRAVEDPVLISAPTPPAICAAVLVLYRNHKDSPVHAVAAEVWQGDRKIGGLQPVHCMGMRGDQVAAYLQEVLLTLREHYGVGRFEDVVKEVPITQCPISGCPISSSQ